MLKKLNPFLMGVCIAYIFLGIVQLSTQQMLSNKIYLTVAIVSLLVTVLEILKIISKRLELSLSRWKDTYAMFYENKSKYATVIATESPVEVIEDYLTNELVSLKQKHDAKSKKYNFAIKISNIAIYVGYAMVVFFMITIPFKDIPNDTHTNIVIGATTLFTFALMFISLIINEVCDNIDQKYLDSLERFNQNAVLVDKIHKLSTNATSTTDKKNSEEEKE